jgi:predicted Zn-dependent protease with MMP-like domain
MIDIPLEIFANLVEEAWSQLPQEWMDRLMQANISWEVLDFADRSTLAKFDNMNPWSLLGLYTGVPMIGKRGMMPLEHPERIQLYRRPILAHSNDFEHLKKMIRHVLYHEIGHHFGLDEDELEEAQKGDGV